ncbi:hypothetical protein B0H11DRAFT_1905086 [Mycena galericulata]|nr:hypothetical protein B0H11DRAFT_1905071 [Mycena galericulata]KAJ7505017.1 hypothetical protein B0H11DRAFT_1905086 [Mycena galericulata]
MIHQTRRGAVFAAWDYDPGPRTLIETSASLGTYTEAALTAVEPRADQQEARSDEGWQGLYADERDPGEREDLASTRPTSPVSDASDPSVFTAGSLRTSVLLNLPFAAPHVAAATASLTDGEDDFDYSTMPPLISDRPLGMVRKRRNRVADARRRRKREAKAAKSPFDKKLNLRDDQSYHTLIRLWTVDELKVLGYPPDKRNGRRLLVIIDSEGRKKGGAFKAKDRVHRRGSLTAGAKGPTFFLLPQFTEWLLSMRQGGFFDGSGSMEELSQNPNKSSVDRQREPATPSYPTRMVFPPFVAKSALDVLNPYRKTGCRHGPDSKFPFRSATYLNHEEGLNRDDEAGRGGALCVVRSTMVTAGDREAIE